MGVDASMYVTGFEPTEKQKAALSFDLAEAFGANWFWIWDAGHVGAKEDRRALSMHEPDLASEWEQVKSPGYEVNIASRYYGPGYERGNLPLILAVSRWLRDRIPGCIVWYGGDESVSELTPEREQLLWDHFVTVGHKPYMSTEPGDEGPICCGHYMTRFGWGGGYAAWRCPGCGMKESHHDGEVVRSRDERDHDAASKRRWERRQAGSPADRSSSQDNQS